MTAIAWNNLLSDLSNLELITDSSQITKLSLDYYHFSPVLQRQLQDKRADLVIRPKTEEEILQVAQTCVNYHIPLTVRGAGTGNYGQSIPLKGGIVLDLSNMNQIKWIKQGCARMEAGIKMAAFDKEAREMGWELRMFPSTYRKATIGGFISGGSGGIGSITYGQLADRGNIQAVKVITLEETPRVLELRGDEVQKVNHAYGTNGIITELELPLAPAYPWSDFIVIFDQLTDGMEFGQALSDSDGIIKKLVSIHDEPICRYFAPLQDFLPQGKSAALVMISQYDVELFKELVKEYKGEISYHKSAQETNKGTLLLEFTWNHTTLHARNVEENLTYLQTLYFNLEKVKELNEKFKDEVIIHLEFIRIGGKAIPAGLPLVHFTTEERLNEIIRYHEEAGVFIANPHTFILEDGGRKVVDPLQLAFKQEVDPYGLMNPGKMRAWEQG
ncbi:MAG: FAD-binding oxidoreductase [Microcystaceae cyanobacterium]